MNIQVESKKLMNNQNETKLSSNRNVLNIVWQEKGKRKQTNFSRRRLKPPKFRALCYIL
jgi:hypothetical protein